MKGNPIKLGTIQGTAGHSSALKMKMEKDAAAKMKKEAAMKMKEEAAMKMKKESAMKMKKESPMDFNAELKKASADGKLSGKFKAAVDASPAKLGTTKPRTKKDMFDKKSFEKKIKERAEKKKATKSPAKFERKSEIKKKERLKVLNEQFGQKGGPEKAATKMKKESMAKMKKKSPMKEKALPTYNKAWENMSEEKKKRFKSKEDFVSQAKAYNEKKYATTEPSKDSRKAGQTRAELAKAHTKTTTKKVKTVKRDGEDVVVKKGVGAKKGKTLTATQKSKERLKIDQANKAIKDAKKAKDFDARDKAQLEKAEIKAGRDDAKTGTALSRAYNRFLVKKNKKQLEKREKKRQKEAEKNKA